MLSRLPCRMTGADSFSSRSTPRLIIRAHHSPDRNPLQWVSTLRTCDACGMFGVNREREKASVPRSEHRPPGRSCRDEIRILGSTLSNPFYQQPENHVHGDSRTQRAHDHHDPRKLTSHIGLRCCHQAAGLTQNTTYLTAEVIRAE